MKSTTSAILPDTDVAAAPADALKRLRELGVIVMPIDPEMNYLRVNFQNVLRPSDSVASLLKALSEQVLWLDLQGTGLSDRGCQAISSLSRLRRLNLSGTRLTDAGMIYLSKLPSLRQLNLTGVPVTLKGLGALAPIRTLEHLYIYKTLVSPSEAGLLAAKLPNTHIDTGGYRMPILAGDTSEVQPEPVKPK